MSGNYFCLCICCGAQFTGHKREVVCLLCRVDRIDSTPKGPTAQLTDAERVWVLANAMKRIERLLRPVASERVEPLPRSPANDGWQLARQALIDSHSESYT